MSTAPDFIDNRAGNTLAKALAKAFADAGTSPGEPARSPGDIAIATSTFTLAGLAELTPHLGAAARVRLLFGVEGPRDLELMRPAPGETRKAFETRLIRESTAESDAAMRLVRDHIPFSETGVGALRGLLDRLKAGHVESRRYERNFLHAKAYIFGPRTGGRGRAGVIAGSSNLTGGGLARNLELNLGNYDEAVVARAQTWFEDLWDDSEKFDLAALLEEIFAPFTPWEIYLRILFQLYGDEIEEEERTDDGLPLTTFQMHGVARALRLIEKNGGALVADEVGLGKTFIAGEIIKIYRSRRQRVLLVCPAQLRDTTWYKFLHTYEFDRGVECISYEQLANDLALGADGPHAKNHLQSPIDDYHLIVVDEAHNYRNDNTPTRAGILRRLLFGQRRDLLLLTATPVNNSLWDLYNVIRFYIRQEAFLANRGVLSLRDRFKEAMQADPSNLSPDLLYPVIDATCVKRTRQFVKKHYAGDTIRGLDGRNYPIVFPKPLAITVRYDLDALLNSLFDKIEVAFDTEKGLKFARYAPQMFLKGTTDNDDDTQGFALAGLMASGLLKRFESSARAFRRTLERLINGHRQFLAALDKGFVISAKFHPDVGADDEAGLEELLTESGAAVPAASYDVKRLHAAVCADLAILDGLFALTDPLTPSSDPKLRALVDELEKIAAEAEKEATDFLDEQQKRKVLIFSFFADTVEYVRDFLDNEVERNPKLRAYRGRIVAVSGGDDLDEDVSRQSAIYGFAPLSSEAQVGRDEDRFDILVTTDVLAEGVNLQQCRHIVNFDLPWNPMRLVQRHGRIDRIGSPHTRVFMRTIFPAQRLNLLLDLESHIFQKIARAAASIGVVSPVAGAAHGSQVFSETREEIERLLKEDPALYERGGTAAAAQTGEEYRQTLRKALAENADAIRDMPWKAGSGMVKGRDRGVLFCATVGGRTYLRFVPADADWQPLQNDAAIVGEIGTCLRLAECEPKTARHFPGELQDKRVFELWRAAQKSVWAGWMRETDPANLQPKIRPLNARVADFIRNAMPPDIDRTDVRRALDIAESPWPRREEMMLREWFDDGSMEGPLKARFLVKQILSTGLEPFNQPEPLPPIEIEDVELVCWLVICPES